MPFNLFGKRKKYPFNKRKKDPAAAVYAGPEYFERRNKVGRIYAGPEYFGFDSDWDRGGGEVEIYAGPEYFEERQRPEREAPEEEAPLPPDDAAPIYAGPEDMGLDPEPVFTGPEDVEEIARMIDDALEKAEVSPPPRCDESENVKDRAPLVYAGPEYFAKRRRAEKREPDDAAFNGVYAGPAPAPGGGMGMMRPSPAEDGKADGEA